MPRGPRLDAPGVLHHVMARGLAQQVIFRDDQDRADFVHRLALLVGAEAWQVYAWAILPNHFHLLVRTGQRPLAHSMRSLLTGYAGTFNRRHHRSGHLVQNRYKSIVCEEKPYFLELVRYLHLNPVRAGVVPDLRALGQYAYSGPAALVGRHRYPWQDTSTVLRRFAATPGRARQEYLAFMAEGVRQGQRPEFQEEDYGGVSEGGRQCRSYVANARAIAPTSVSWGVRRLSNRCRARWQGGGRRPLGVSKPQCGDDAGSRLSGSGGKRGRRAGQWAPGSPESGARRGGLSMGGGVEPQWAAIGPAVRRATGVRV